MTKSFTFPYKVSLVDLDYMKVVGHVRWLEILQRAREEMIESSGISLQKFFKSDVGIVVRKFSLRYRQPALLGNQLDVIVTATKALSYGCEMSYEVRNEAKELLLTAELQLVFIDAKNKPTDMPPAFKKALFA